VTGEVWQIMISLSRVCVVLIVNVSFMHTSALRRTRWCSWVSLYANKPPGLNMCFTYTVTSFPSHLGLHRAPVIFVSLDPAKPDNSWRCKTTDTWLVRRVVRLFILPSFCSYSLCLPIKRWPGWVDLGGWLHTEILRPTRPQRVVRPSTNRARLKINALLLRQILLRQTATLYAY